jgi:hypothetical protein
MRGSISNFDMKVLEIWNCNLDETLQVHSRHGPLMKCKKKIGVDCRYFFELFPVERFLMDVYGFRTVASSVAQITACFEIMLPVTLQIFFHSRVAVPRYEGRNFQNTPKRNIFSICLMLIIFIVCDTA